MMQYISMPKSIVALSADGGATGILTVASTTNIYVGQKGWLRDNNSTGIYVKVLEILTSTTFRVGLERDVTATTTFPLLNYGPVDCSAYTLAQSASIAFPAQVVQVYGAFNKPA